MADLQSLLDECRFYYSETYDLTHTSQRISKFTEQDKKKTIWERADDRFFWNKHIMKEFIKLNLREWILIFIDGFIEFSKFNLSHSLPSTSPLSTNQTASQSTPYLLIEGEAEEFYYYILVSRREYYRTGTRFHTRGADPLGNVANFVETEQMVEFNGNISSFVETRGSIPLIWYQYNALKSKPTVDYSPFTVLFRFFLFFSNILQINGPWTFFIFVFFFFLFFWNFSCIGPRLHLIQFFKKYILFK